METFQHIEVFEKFGEEILNRIQNFSTSIFYTNKDETIFQHCGSGTFIQQDSCKFILTAAHVAEEIEKHDYFGFAVLQKVHLAKYETRYFEFKYLRSTSYSEKGPDLALIKIPSKYLGAIEAVKSFVDTKSHKTLSEDERFGEEKGLWAIVGFPDESTTEYQTEKSLVKGLHGAIMLVPLDKYISEDPLDYLHISLDGTQKGLSSYGGMSGGGAWHVIVSKRDGEMHLEHIILKGVIYYQLPEMHNERTIICHGKNTIYKFIQNSA